MQKTIKLIWDKLGISASAICLVHCIALPFILAFFPSIMVLGEDEFFHRFFAGFILLSALMAFIPGYLKHRRKWVLVTSSLAILIIFYAAFFAHEQLGHHWEEPITIVGSILLIFSHFKNMKLTNKCKHEHCHTC